MDCSRAHHRHEYNITDLSEPVHSEEPCLIAFKDPVTDLRGQLLTRKIQSFSLQVKRLVGLLFDSHHCDTAAF